MKERPILFSAPMVRAILEGRKMQTRRICKGARELSCAADWQLDQCPCGQCGDRLWVRETWRHTASTLDEARALTEDILSGTAVDYRATSADELVAEGMGRADAEECVQWERWRPSIHMPRWASRITLEITGVRVERLQDMEGQGPYPGESDALAEGVNAIHHGDGAYYYSAFRDEPHPKNWCDPADAFRELWESINGAGSWAANPWVWVIEFKRVEAA